MSWTTPLTAVSNAALTAAQWNASVRDNLLETAVAKATTAGRLFVTTGANQLAERIPGYVFTGGLETTASTTYTDLTTVGPQITATSGTRAIVAITSDIWNTANSYSFASTEVSGASTVAAVDAAALIQRVVTGGDANTGVRTSVTIMFSGLNAGSNTFTMKYRTTAGIAKYTNRNLLVLPL